jgi:shikimate kinase
MRVFLVGVGCVGKTTVGRLLASRLGYPFFDVDEEIEKHFGTSIERLQASFLTDYSYSKETSVVLKRIVTENQDCVAALPPSGLRDAYCRVVRQVDCVTIAIEDTPENILERITFYDVNSRLIERHLTDEEKRLHRKEIKKDITFFTKSYQRADLHADVAGLDADAVAEMIEGMLTPYQEGRIASGTAGGR